MKKGGNIRLCGLAGVAALVGDNRAVRPAQKLGQGVFAIGRDAAAKRDGALGKAIINRVVVLQLVPRGFVPNIVRLRNYSGKVLGADSEPAR